MPIIKDKYGKGSQDRSKFLTRTNNKALINSVPTGINALQKKELEKESYRSTGVNKNETAIGHVVQSKSTLKGFNIPTANEVNQIFTISPGIKIKNIIINNNSSSESGVISLYWSGKSQQDATFTVSSGVVTAVTGITLYSIFSETFLPHSTITLEHLISGVFEKLNKEAYLYIVSSIAGPTITISYSNE